MTRIVERKRLILIDDHQLVLDSLEKFLQPRFDVVAKLTDANNLMDVVESVKPDVVVLDIGLPGVNGLTAARRLLQRWPHTKIIFVTQQRERALVKAASSMGVSGYVLKEESASQLVSAIQRILEGQRVFPVVEGTA